MLATVSHIRDGGLRVRSISLQLADSYDEALMAYEGLIAHLDAAYVHIDIYIVNELRGKGMLYEHLLAYEFHRNELENYTLPFNGALAEFRALHLALQEVGVLSQESFLDPYDIKSEFDTLNFWQRNLRVVELSARVLIEQRRTDFLLILELNAAASFLELRQLESSLCNINPESFLYPPS